MKKNKKVLIGLLTGLLVLSMLFISCNNGNTDTLTVPNASKYVLVTNLDDYNGKYITLSQTFESPVPLTSFIVGYAPGTYTRTNPDMGVLISNGTATIGLYNVNVETNVVTPYTGNDTDITIACDITAGDLNYIAYGSWDHVNLSGSTVTLDGTEVFDIYYN
ncbi:MAG: hypothetical protein LBM77_09620 [Spirochaetaceae bacterium]|jgi:hypothetical protein|nr:hypothetical protein [Spirochaetaceae bacterium]